MNPQSYLSFLPSASQRRPRVLSLQNSLGIDEKSKGILVLLTVPLAWGTFEVAVRYVYTMQPPVPSLLFSLAYYATATTALWILNQLMLNGSTDPDTAIRSVDRIASRQQNAHTTKANDTFDDKQVIISSSSSSNQISSDDATSDTSITMTPPPQGLTNEPLDELSLFVSTTSAISSPAIATTKRIRNGGIELGTYLFIGNLFQLLGLVTVSSDRAAFLLQLTTVFVPIASTLFAVATTHHPTTVTNTGISTNVNMHNDDRVRPSTTISTRMWIACIIALLGVGILSFDNSSVIEAVTTVPVASAEHSGMIDNILSQFHWSTGDTLVVLAAVAYTLHCIRLEVFAKLCDSAVELASYKAGTELVWTMITVLVVVFVSTVSPLLPSDVNIMMDTNGVVSFILKSGQEIQQYWASMSLQPFHVDSSKSLPVLLAVMWTGLVPIAYTIVAQTYGQRRVVPVTANLIYTIQPLGTAFFAYLVLHESLTLWGYIGGFIIGIAVLLVVTSTATDD